MISQTMGAREWAMLLTLSVLWGGSFFFVEVVVHQLSPLTIVSLRVGLAALALWAFVFATGQRFPRALSAWKAFLAMGVLNNVIPFTLIVWGQQHIASGLAAILNATTPLFTVVVAGVLLADERPTRLKFVGVFIGFAGVVFMVGPRALVGLGTEVVAQLAILAAAISYAFAGVFGRRFKTMRVPPVVIAAGQVTASSMLLVPIAWIVESPVDVLKLSAGATAAILCLAVLSTAVAYVLYFRILDSAGATNLLLVTFLIPVTAVLLGVMILGESLEWIHLVGMGLIGLGLAAIDGRLCRRQAAGGCG